MSGFLYFVPHDGKACNQEKTADFAEANGLAYAFEDPPTVRGVTGGPEGQNGVIIVDSATVARFGYYPDQQTWLKIPNSKNWMGFQTNSRPTEKELARDYQIEGWKVVMPDGAEWLIPLARAVNGSSPMPSKTIWDGTDWSRGDVLEHYKDLFGDACELYDRLLDAGAEGLTVTKDTPLVIRALAMNYRIGPAEAMMLDLISEDSIVKVLEALIDGPVVEDLTKKIEAGVVSL